MLAMKSVKDHNDNPSVKKQNAETKKRKSVKNSLSHLKIDKDKIEDEPQEKQVKKNKDSFETSENLNCTAIDDEMNLKEKRSKKSNQNTDMKLQEPDFIKKKKVKSRMYINPKETTINGDYETDTPILKKKKCLNIINEDYKPGMLSNQLQVKKHDNLHFPWDSSFGLNPEFNNFTKQEFGSDCENKNKKKLIKINPLFDLSKRQNENKTVVKNDSSLDTVFVGNLPTTTKIGDIKKLFRKCGVIRSAKLRHKEVKNKKLTSKDDSNNDSKYINAKVKFATADSCQSALKMNGFLYEGHHIRVTLAGDEGKMNNPEKCVFVGNLAFKTQDDDLWKAFENCGEIESVRIIRDEKSGKGKGFGYVNFKSTDSIKMALKKDGNSILDREIRVRKNSNNVQSLSDLITIKRKKLKKRKRIMPQNKDNETKSIDLPKTSVTEEKEVLVLKHNEGKKKKRKSYKT